MNLSSRRLQNLNRSVGRCLLLGFAAIGVFFGGMGGWAAFAPLESAALAPGVVIVDSKRKTVAHLEGGIVKKILVREGDEVRAGDVLVRLDETRARAKLGILSSRQAAAMARLARLRAERDGAPEIVFPDALLAKADDPDIAALLESERNVFAARREALAGQVSILDQQIAQYKEEIAGLESQIAAEDRQIAITADEIAIVARLMKSGNARRPRLMSLQRAKSRLEGSRAQNLAAIARARQNIAEARLRQVNLRDERHDEVVQEIRSVQETLLDLQERIRAAADVLARLDIRAPVDGTVVDLRIHTEGGVIEPGAPILDIVPRQDRLIVETRISTDDIDVVRPGLPAEVRLTAYNARTTPVLEGSLIQVSADRFTDERTGEPYYLGQVRVDDESPGLGDIELYPGMSAQVMIRTGRRTALSYLLAPISASFDRAFREQ